MIEPIAWHEMCLKNRKKSLKRARDALKVSQDYEHRLTKECNILSAQIKLAKKEGKISFNAETYGVNRSGFEWVD